eukprot:s3152_g9.t5
MQKLEEISGGLHLRTFGAFKHVYLSCIMETKPVSCFASAVPKMFSSLCSLVGPDRPHQSPVVGLGRGVVFGIEQDPRNARLVRMFIEYRNEIVADMVLCEVFEERDEARSIRVHQEIFDGLDILLFRVTLFRADGDHQVASLKLRNEQLEEFDMSPTRHLHSFEEPSWRFPISPLAKRMSTTPGSRLFIYTGVPYIPEEATCKGETSEAPRSPSESGAEAQLWKRPLIESVVVVGDFCPVGSHLPESRGPPRHPGPQFTESSRKPQTVFMVSYQFGRAGLAGCWPKAVLPRWQPFKLHDRRMAMACGYSTAALTSTEPKEEVPTANQAVPSASKVSWVVALRAALNHGGTRRPKRWRREAKRKQLQLATVDPDTLAPSVRPCCIALLWLIPNYRN